MKANDYLNLYLINNHLIPQYHGHYIPFSINPGGMTEAALFPKAALWQGAGWYV
jgi:hypothetical protein